MCDVLLMNVATTYGGIPLNQIFVKYPLNILIEYLLNISKIIIISISQKGGKHCRVCSNVGPDEGEQE